MEVKRDVNFERRVVTWVEKVLNEDLPDKDDLWASLKSGVVLCKLINTIKPGTVPTIHTTKMIPLKEMENIQLFLKGSWTLGVASSDLFITSDLYRRKNMAAVVQCLHALALQAPNIGWEGPVIEEESARLRESRKSRKWTSTDPEIWQTDPQIAQAEIKNLRATQESLIQELAVYKRQLDTKGEMAKDADDFYDSPSLHKGRSDDGFFPPNPVLPRSSSQPSDLHRGSLKDPPLRARPAASSRAETPRDSLSYQQQVAIGRPNDVSPASSRAASPSSDRARNSSVILQQSPRFLPEPSTRERELENELAAALRRERLALSQVAELTSAEAIRRKSSQSGPSEAFRIEMSQLIRENAALKIASLGGGAGGGAGPVDWKEHFKDKIREEVDLQADKLLESFKASKQAETDALLQYLAQEKEQVKAAKADVAKLSLENTALKKKVHELERDVRVLTGSPLTFPTLAREIVQEGANSFYYNPELVVGMGNKDIAAAQSKLRQLLALGSHVGLSPDDHAAMQPLFNSDTGRRVFTVLLQELVNKRQEELNLSAANYKFLLELITTLLRKVESHKEFVTLTVIMDACFRTYYEPAPDAPAQPRTRGSSLALQRMASAIRLAKPNELKESKVYLQQEPTIRSYFGAMSVDFWEEYFWKRSIRRQLESEDGSNEQKRSGNNNNNSLIEEELLEFAYDMFHWGVALDRVKEFSNNIAYFGLGLGNEELVALIAKIDDYVATSDFNLMPTNLQEKHRQSQEVIQQRAEALEQEKSTRRSQQCRTMSVMEGELLLAVTAKSWERRYVALSRCNLQIFRKPGDKVPLLTLTLSPFSVVEPCLDPPALPGQFSFSVACVYFNAEEFLNMAKPCTRLANAKSEACTVPTGHRRALVNVIPDLKAEAYEKEIDAENCVFLSCSSRLDRYRWLKALRAVIGCAPELELQELNVTSVYARKEQGFELKKRVVCFEDLLEIGSVGRLNPLLTKHISLEQCVLGTLTAAFFSTLSCCSALSTLELSSCALLDHGLYSLLRLIATSTEIDLIINGVTDFEECPEFAKESKACSLPHLKKLSLTNNGFSAVGMRALSCVLSTNNSIKELVLDRNPIKDVGAAWLARALSKNITIEVLKICGCGLGSDGAIALLRVIDPEFKERPAVPLLDVPDEGGVNQTLKRLVTSGNQDVRPDLRAHLMQLLTTKKAEDPSAAGPSSPLRKGEEGQVRPPPKISLQDDLRAAPPTPSAATAPSSPTKSSLQEELRTPPKVFLDEPRTPPPPPPLPRHSSFSATNKGNASPPPKL